MTFGLVSVLAERGLRLTVALVATFVIARHIGVANFGLLGTAQAIVALTGPLIVLGLDQIGVRELILRPRQRHAIIGTTAFLQLAGGGVAALICIACALLVREEIPGLAPFLFILALQPLLQWPAIGEYILRAEARNTVIATGRAAATLAYAAAALILLSIDAPALAFAWLAVADLALLALVQVAFLVLAEHPIRFTVSWTQAAALLRDSWPLVLSGLAVMVYMRTDQVMLAGILGETAAGTYTAAARISEAWYIVPITVAYVLGPVLLRRGDPNTRGYLEALFSTTRKLLAVTMIIAIGVSLSAPSIVSAIYGPAYTGAGPVLALHFWNAVFVTLGVLQSLWFVATNRTRISLYRTLGGALVNVLLNLLLIPSFGPVGAAAATLVAQVTAAFLSNGMLAETRPFLHLQARTLFLLPAYPAARPVIHGRVR